MVGRSFDVCWVIAAAVRRRGRKQSGGQTCQRHAGGEENQSSHQDIHGASHNRSKE